MSLFRSALPFWGSVAREPGLLEQFWTLWKRRGMAEVRVDVRAGAMAGSRQCSGFGGLAPRKT